MSTTQGRVVSQKSDGIAYLTIDNPNRRNAISASMLRSFVDLLPELDRDEEVRVIILRGNRDFAAGGDLTEGTDPQEMAELSVKAFEAFASVKKPFIAAIRGYCIGGAIGIAMKADIRIASRTARFSLPEARIGSTYPITETEDLVREMGPSAVKTMLFTGDQVTAEEAFRMGLVNKLADDDQFDEMVAIMATRIAANAPLAIKLFKTTIHHITQGGDRSEVERLNEACMLSEDAAEGLRAFAEKRPPRFTGR